MGHATVKECDITRHTTMHGHTDQISTQIKARDCDWTTAYPKDEVDGGEGQAAGEADWAASHKARPCRLQPPALLHIPQGLSLGTLLEAQPCTTQGLTHQHSCSKLM